MPRKAKKPPVSVRSLLVEDAAARLSWSVRTLKRRMKANEIAYFKFPSGKVGIPVEEVDRVLAEAYVPRVA